MKRTFRDMTIRNKLTVLMMGVSATVVLLTCFIFYVMTTSNMKKTYQAGLVSIAQVLGRNCEAPVAFQLPEDAIRVIASLEERPSVVYALIRDAEGRIFAEYGKKPLGTPGSDDQFPGYLTVQQNIMMGNRVMGTLTLYDNQRGIVHARTVAVSMLIFALIASLLAAGVLVAPLQRLISEPIMALAATSESITQKQNFSLRAEKKGNDEVGKLVDSFNAMISRIEAGKSERIEAETERNKLEQQLQQAQKMEAIGALAGGVAHDFNNILSAIIGYGAIMKRRMPQGDPQQHNLEQILAAAERATGLTKSLLAFSRKQVIELKPVDVNEMVSGFQKILARLIGEDIEFTVHGHPGRLIVEADKGQLEQVLMNLVTNARDAMPKGGAIVIETSALDVGKQDLITHNISTPGRYAYVTISDTGMGFDKETQEHIFEPFFTTKEVGKGTGLGLSIVYGIIKKHNGFINVYSEPGKGTAFKIYLPLHAISAQSVQEDRLVSPPRGTETILLVEDNDSVRQMMTIVLEEFGYTVIGASDGLQAIELFQNNRDRVQLVVSDLIMPRMNGKDAYEEMRKIRPDLKAIFSSGYTADIIAQKGLLEEGINFLSKPVAPAEMLIMIRTVLEK